MCTGRNGTHNPGCNSTMTCPDGCLFDLEADPGEYVNVAAAQPAAHAALKARLAALQPSIFAPVRTGGGTDKADQAASARGGCKSSGLVRFSMLSQISRRSCGRLGAIHLPVSCLQAPRAVFSDRSI